MEALCSGMDILPAATEQSKEARLISAKIFECMFISKVFLKLFKHAGDGYLDSSFIVSSTLHFNQNAFSKKLISGMQNNEFISACI